MTMNLLLPLSENKLCNNCETLLQRFQSTLRSKVNDTTDQSIFDGVHHEDGYSFFAAGDSGCRICNILWRLHIRTQGTRDEKFYTSAHLRLEFQREMPSAFVYFTIKHKEKHWQPNSHYTQVRLNIFLEDDSRYNHLLETCRTSPLSESMDDPAVFELAGRWLSSCITKSSGHKNCYHSTIVKFHPRRLLDIRGESVILSLKTQRATYEPYCALSYCWGEEPTQLILTQSNEKELCQGIDINTLPETIQDAICVTKKLGINYIWIDRLCIIQRGDEGHDWMKHSSEMSSIYSHCILNLSVDRAKSAIEGFLGPRNWPPLQPIFIKRQLNEDLSVFSKKCVITFRNVTDIALVTEPLGSRAWILSERVLSPRTLHFGAGEMFWECTGCHIASESCPYGFSTVLENFAYANYSLTHSNSDRKRFEDWIGILTNYSRLSLSHPSADKLVALAGVARFYEETTGNNLVAGILKSTLPMSLLWERNQVTKATRSSTYRAPSWSWASMDGALNFYQSRDPFGFSRDVAEVRDVWVKPVDEDNNLGQLEDGAITIYGPAMFLEDFDRVAPEFPKLGRRFHTYWDEPQHEELKETVLVLFLSIFTGADSDSDIVHAILLTPSKKKEMWVRVGVSALYFARGEKSEASENSKSREFLEKRDLRTVTIV